VDAIDLDEGRADWEGESVDDSFIVAGKLLEVLAYDLSGGIFEATESFCQSHQLPFVRSSGSCVGAFGPERVVFPGTGLARHFELTENDEVALTRREFREFGSVEAVERWYASAEFQPPPFSIVEDEEVQPASDEVGSS
jgi:hypothetical protein